MERKNDITDIFSLSMHFAFAEKSFYFAMVSFW
jgi:hypothetical protein